MPPVKSLGNSRAKYNYKFGLTGLEAADPYVPPEPPYVDDVFSTYVETATTDQSLNIDNGIDFATHGGLVWLKRRNGTAGTYTQHALIDTERNADTALLLPSTSGNQVLTGSPHSSSFDSDGFTWGSENDFHPTGADYVSWSFRKSPGFFDVVTWVGTDSDQTIPHNLGSVPGCIIVKRTDSTGGDWYVYHRSLATATENWIRLNNTGGANGAIGQDLWGPPTSTTFKADTYLGLSTLDATYVAYVFAHDDQSFGTNENESIIKCGSFTTGTNGITEVDLGWEPQWLLVKTAGENGGWYMTDNMRGLVEFSVAGTKSLIANSDSIEGGTSNWGPTSTGFKTSYGGTNGIDLIYVAIRRPHKPITDPTKLFTVGGNTSSEPEYVSNFVVDMAFHRNLGTNLQDDTVIFSRLTGSKALTTNSTASETTPNAIDQFDFMDGWGDNQANNSSYKSWMFRRAPGFFDVVAYVGDSDAARQIPHNLEVKPEMIIIKNRSYTSGTNWTVWHKDIYDTTMVLNGNQGWVNGGPTSTYGGSGTGSSTGAALLSSTSTYFKPGSGFLENSTGETYISYHFASLSGVSKIGSYSGGGSSDVSIDCGFTNGARFVMIKRTDEVSPGNAGDWYIWDKTRGINASTEPYFKLNTTDAQVTTSDFIDPHPQGLGFVVAGGATAELNQSGGTYIYLAIA